MLPIMPQLAGRMLRRRKPGVLASGACGPPHLLMDGERRFREATRRDQTDRTEIRRIWIKMVIVVWPVVLLALGLSATLPAETRFFPLKDIKPGLQGVGKSVFTGDRVEEFQVEILGVLENVGPRQSLILGRLSGGPIERTGVMQGMSGSPVYIDGKLAGAVAMAFPFAKEPVAGIRPIGEILPVGENRSARAARPARQRASLADTDLTRSLPRPVETTVGETKLVDIATPVSFSGFTRETIDAFAPQLRALGLEPRSGVAGGGAASTRLGDTSRLQPGSMISVQLVTGDMSIGADGTVTHIDGSRIYAFGHRFLAIGATDLPFARSEVLTLLPSLATSFKISSAKELMGVISQDRNTAVFGELGRRAAMVPLSIAVKHPSGKRSVYRMEMVNDRLLSPFLVQMAVFSTIDATERAVGTASYAVNGEIEFSDGTAPVKLNNMYAGDSGSAMQVSLGTAIPLAYVLQGGFEDLQIKKVALEIQAFDEKKQLQIDQVATGRREVRPGETVELHVTLLGENGVELTRKVRYPVPIGAPAGPLNFTVADGATANWTDLRQVLTSTPKSPAQLVWIVNQLRANTKAYVRAWRPDLAFQIDADDLPAPPPSVSLILSDSQSLVGGLGQTRNSKVAEFEIAAGDYVITGSKTIQVEVKE